MTAPTLTLDLKRSFQEQVIRLNTEKPGSSRESIKCLLLSKSYLRCARYKTDYRMILDNNNPGRLLSHLLDDNWSVRTRYTRASIQVSHVKAHGLILLLKPKRVALCLTKRMSAEDYNNYIDLLDATNCKKLSIRTYSVNRTYFRKLIKHVAVKLICIVCDAWLLECVNLLPILTLDLLVITDLCDFASLKALSQHKIDAVVLMLEDLFDLEEANAHGVNALTNNGQLACTSVDKFGFFYENDYRQFRPVFSKIGAFFPNMHNVTSAIWSDAPASYANIDQLVSMILEAHQSFRDIEQWFNTRYRETDIVFTLKVYRYPALPYDWDQCVSTLKALNPAFANCKLSEDGLHVKTDNALRKTFFQVDVCIKEDDIETAIEHEDDMETAIERD